MSSERVQIVIADHVAVVTLNRPEKHNALDGAMFDAIIAAATRLRSEPGVRAVVLHGEGPSLCSGLDVAALMSAQPNGEAIPHHCAEPCPTASSARPTIGSSWPSR
jgi:enoyl-CoA hydratase/carnithine racemase